MDYYRERAKNAPRSGGFEDRFWYFYMQALGKDAIGNKVHQGEELRVAPVQGTPVRQQTVFPPQGEAGFQPLNGVSPNFQPGPKGALGGGGATPTPLTGGALRK